MNQWDRINFRTEEKKRRYAKLNELTMDELNEFRIETRKNLGHYFIDTEKENRKDNANKKISESKKWEIIRKTAAHQASIANETLHETI